MKCMVTVIAVAGLIATAQAHGTVFALWVNGKSQGDGRKTYIRSPEKSELQTCLVFLGDCADILLVMVQ